MADNYEFSPEQEQQMARLARMLRITGVAFITVALVEELMAFTKAYSVASLNIQIDWMEFAYESIAAVLYAFIGVTLWRVAYSFALLATTEGHDIPHLMDAIEKVDFCQAKAGYSAVPNSPPFGSLFVPYVAGIVVSMSEIKRIAQSRQIVAADTAFCRFF